MVLSIRGKSWGSASHAYEVAKRRGAYRLDYLLRYATALWKDCDALGIRADVAFAQADLETGSRQTGIGFQSARWTEEGNPAGIGVVTNLPDGTPVHTFIPESAARVHATHLAGYAGITPPPDWITMDYRWDAMMRAGYFGSSDTTDDLGTRWAEGSDYGPKIESRWKNYAFTEPQQTGEPAMETPYSVSWPGVPGGPVSFTFPFKLMIVPSWRTQQRPGLKARLPRLPVQHENGNPDAYAVGDSTYLYNGAGGRTASWHATVDHREGFANLPGDEVGYHASDGAGPGNFQGFAIELSQRSLKHGTAAEKRQARRNAAEVMGRVCIARLKGNPPAKMHRDYAPDKKRCPEYFLNEPAAWNQYVDDVMMFANDELQKMGQAPMPQPEEEIVRIGDTIEAIVNLNLRQTTRLAAPIVKTLPAGTQMTVIGRWESADGYGWLPVRTDGLAGAVAMGDGTEPFIKKVATPTPRAQVYAEKMPIADLLRTDLKVYETAPGIRTVNEQEFVFVGDVIEFTHETVAAQHGGKGAPAVKAPYKVGERAIAAWLFETTDNGWFYLLAGGDDEWVRVPYGNTKHVSDAPLLGDDME